MAKSELKKIAAAAKRQAHRAAVKAYRAEFGPTHKRLETEERARFEVYKEIIKNEG